MRPTLCKGRGELVLPWAWQVLDPVHGPRGEAEGRSGSHAAQGGARWGGRSDTRGEIEGRPGSHAAQGGARRGGAATFENHRQQPHHGIGFRSYKQHFGQARSHNCRVRRPCHGAQYHQIHTTRLRPYGSHLLAPGPYSPGPGSCSLGLSRLRPRNVNAGPDASAVPGTSYCPGPGRPAEAAVAAARKEEAEEVERAPMVNAGPEVEVVVGALAVVVVEEALMEVPAGSCGESRGGMRESLRL